MKQWRFITDIGKSQVIVFVCESDGRELREKVDRYAVWETANVVGSQGKVIAHGNDLGDLQRQWGPNLKILVKEPTDD